MMLGLRAAGVWAAEETGRSSHAAISISNARPYVLISIILLFYGNMIKAVLWDLDGTLVDSADFHWQAWRDVMAEAGSPIMDEQFVHSFGKRNDLILAGWLGEGSDPGRMRRLSEEKESRFRTLVLAHGIEPLPGVGEWVARLHAEGWRHAIATSAPRLNLETLIDAMEMRQDFDADVAAEDVTHGKPDPEVFLLAASIASAPIPAARSSWRTLPPASRRAAVPGCARLASA